MWHKKCACALEFTNNSLQIDSQMLRVLYFLQLITAYNNSFHLFPWKNLQTYTKIKNVLILHETLKTFRGSATALYRDEMTVGPDLDTLLHGQLWPVHPSNGVGFWDKSQQFVTFMILDLDSERPLNCEWKPEGRHSFW